MSEEPQTPAGPGSAPEHVKELEDLKQFLQTNGKSILLAVLVAAVVYVSITGYRNNRAAKAELASVALASAQSGEELESLLAEYGSTPSAPGTLLTLAGRHFREGRYDEAKAAYEQFRAEYPRHPMLRATELCLAQVTEASGDAASAQAMFEAFLADHPDNYLVPLARMGRARCLHQLGALDEARTVYEDFLAAHPEGPWTTMAETNLELVRKAMRAAEQPLPPLVIAEPEKEPSAEPTTETVTNAAGNV